MGLGICLDSMGTMSAHTGRSFIRETLNTHSSVKYLNIFIYFVDDKMKGCTLNRKELQNKRYMDDDDCCEQSESNA